MIYALRVALLLSLATLLVQSLKLPHGKWLLFTLASVSLPYADDVGQKAEKRLFATAAGGIFSVILYSLGSVSDWQNRHYDAVGLSELLFYRL